MFCTNCGKKIKEGGVFCSECGHLVDITSPKKSPIEKSINIQNEKWWYRLLKVLYLIALLPLLGIIIIVWSSYTPYCYSYSCYGSYNEAFWYSLLTLVIGLIVLRLIKLAVIYVTIGRKPDWKKEFKKLL
jgi:uncharacterized membrane protein